MTRTDPAATGEPRPRRSRRLRWVASTAVLGVAAGAASLLGGGEPADAAASSATFKIKIQAGGVALPGDSGTTFLAPSYGWSATVPYSGNVPSGTFTIGDLTFTHPVGMGSASLGKALTSNQRVDATVDSPNSVGASGSSQPATTYKLTSCKIVDLTHTGASGSGVEQVKLRCTSVMLVTRRANPDGTVTGNEVDFTVPRA